MADRPSGGVPRNTMAFLPSSGKPLANYSDLLPILCRILHQYRAAQAVSPRRSRPPTQTHPHIYSPSLHGRQCVLCSSVDSGILHLPCPPTRARPSSTNFDTPSPSPLCSLASSQRTACSSCPLSFGSHACAAQ